jgi:hypothetical protein
VNGAQACFPCRFFRLGSRMANIGLLKVHNIEVIVSTDNVARLRLIPYQNKNSISPAVLCARSSRLKFSVYISLVVESQFCL